MEDSTAVEDREVARVDFGPHETEGQAATRRAATKDEREEVVDGRRFKTPDVAVEDAEAATEWLLAAFRDELPAREHTLRLNVGTLSQPRWLPWTIRSVEKPVIDKLQAQSLPAQNRAMRRGGAAVTMKEGQDAQWKLDVRLVIEGSVNPDVKKTCLLTGLKSPEEFIIDAFKNNSGLVPMIASAILTLSGYDEDNVQDVIEGAAAGNS